MKKIISMTFGLLFIVGFVFVIFLLTKYVWNILITVQSTLASTLVTASVTIFVSVIVVVLSKYYEQKAKIRSELREKKVPVYLELINFIFKIAFAERTGQKEPDENDIVQFFAGFTEKLVVWASDDVVDAFYRFRMNSVKSSQGMESNHKVLFDIEAILFAIRKDLGHSNKGLSKGKLLGIWVNDIESYL